ncbi:unnamed protein product [Rhodiola kirilowii]
MVRPTGLVIWAWILLLIHINVELCWSLNEEGLALMRFRERVVSDPLGGLINWEERIGEDDPCSWFGVGCVDGKVIFLNLKDLRLKGTLGPELGELISIRSIVLRNNLFFGEIPAEMGDLQDLEVLDLGYNNLSGLIPLHFGPSVMKLLFDNNELLGTISPEFEGLQMYSKPHIDQKEVINHGSDITCFGRSVSMDSSLAGRRQLQAVDDTDLSKAKANALVIWNLKLPPLLPSPFRRSSPSFSPAPSQGSPSASPAFSPAATPFGVLFPPTPASDPDPLIPEILRVPPPHGSAFIPLTPKLNRPSTPNHHHLHVAIVGIAASFLLVVVSFIGVKICQNQKLVTVQPWKTGLSGQLQKAFVTGVPKLKRSELEAACEDFSNIIGTLSDGSIMFKGTLSSGVEIAVTSAAVTFNKDWTKQLEAQFRKKVGTLSKVNHKNFVNLLGFCEEEEPFTRMMVFEYAPNGSLFEHLHIKEAEHLDWRMRLKVAMGVAYCLEHMHQLSQSAIHENLQSSCIFLTEDYAAKVSVLSLLNEIMDSKMTQKSNEPQKTLSASLQKNVYSFGGLLLELISGRHLLLEEKPVKDWVTKFLQADEPLEALVDPTLNSFSTEELKKMLDVIRECLQTDPKRRPSMSDVARWLRDITKITPEEAIPKVSPLWWAELEIISTEE